MQAEIKIRLCVDCVFADANGASTPEDQGGPCADWQGFDDRWQGYGFDAETVRYGDVHEIREPSFSWSPCDGCGSGLGGDRFDYIAYQIRKDAR